MKINDLHFYDDIIKLEYHKSLKHQPMKLSDRAAQFGAFEALGGHSDAINETARITEKEQCLSEYVIEILNAKLNIINDNISDLPEITVTYFNPDDKKTGGFYEIYTGNLRRIDEYNGTLVFDDGTEIHIKFISNIRSKYDSMLSDI